MLSIRRALAALGASFGACHPWSPHLHAQPTLFCLSSVLHENGVGPSMRLPAHQKTHLFLSCTWPSRNGSHTTFQSISKVTCGISRKATRRSHLAVAWTSQGIMPTVFSIWPLVLEATIGRLPNVEREGLNRGPGEASAWTTKCTHTPSVCPRSPTLSARSQLWASYASQHSCFIDIRKRFPV